MAPVHVARQLNSFEPPPSSILATHVVHGNGVPDLDRDNFNQLLAEVLSTDEHGQPNLGADVSVNHKLICIIFQVGIETALEENPFKSNAGSGKTDSQLLNCLEAIQLAVERSPQVIAVKSDIQGQDDAEWTPPLYTWLFPRLLPLVVPSQAVQVRDGVCAIYNAMLQANMKCAQSNQSQSLLEYFRLSLLGALRLSTSPGSASRRPLIIDGEDFGASVPKFSRGKNLLLKALSFADRRELLSALCNVMRVIAKYSDSTLDKIQYKKLVMRIRRTVDDVGNEYISDEHLEELRRELGALDLLPARLPEQPNMQGLDKSWPETNRARKRLRLSTDEDDGPLAQGYKKDICRRLTSELTSRAVSDLDGLSQTAAAGFQRMTSEKQSASIELIGLTACKISSSHPDLVCQFCDTGETLSDDLDIPRAEETDELLKTLLILIPSISRQSKTRVIAMAALRRVIAHLASANNLKLTQTPAGDWCLQSLKSSSRDLRLAATRTLQTYVVSRKNVDTALIRENRIAALDFLQNLWQKGEVAVQETTVLALTLMAQVVGDEELNIILVRLVEYLGHTNPYISGVVYAGIQQLAQAMQVTVWPLLRPFWRTLGVVLAKSISSRPQVAHQLCDLLGMDMSGLMNHAAEYALPYLVLHKDHETIRRFAEANGQSTTAFEICTLEKNLTAILSYLLVQPFPDPEQAIIKILTEVSEEFGKSDLATWIAHDPIHITCELLKAIGDSGQGKSSRIYQALQLHAQLVARQRGQSSGSRRGDGIGTFLENNVLAIVTHFTVLLNDLEAKEPKLEKRRCLSALGEVVKLGKSRVTRALPQICACLRSGLDDAELCNAAFASWAAMIKSLKSDDIVPLIDQTIAIIVQTWELLDSASQQQAYDVVGDLLRNHTDLVRENFDTIPSLSTIPVMTKFETEIGSLKRQMDERHQLIAYAKRLGDENVSVVEQALVELSPLLREKQDFLQRCILQEQPDELVAGLTRALLDACIKFNNSARITGLCGQCLGSIGCLDPSKIESIRERKTMVVLSNFAKADEVIQWMFLFLQSVLVPSFLSATTTRAQGFLGWAMQEFLKCCEQGTPSKSRSGNLASKLWDEMPESIKNTLTPFLSSKYTVQEVRAPPKGQYPFFKTGMKHRDWLRTITLDFLHRGPGENVDIVFGISCRIINGQDTAIPAFLLPYAAVNLIVSGVESDSQEIIEEITSILSLSLEGQDRRVQDDIKLCSQTVFEMLDYMSSWHQQKRKQYSIGASRSERGGQGDTVLGSTAAQIRSIERVLESIPPDVLARRSLECKSYARALFHWEQHIRKSKSENPETELQRLQDIYAQIDEPDGIEGISSRMHVLDIEQQVLEHRKAGRWTAAQSWYEMQLVAHPDDIDVQKNLMVCLKESGQYDVLLHHFDGIKSRSTTPNLLTSYAMEAAWATNRWDRLSSYLPNTGGYDFASHVAEIMLAVNEKDDPKASTLIEELYRTTASEFTPNTITSLHAGHDTLLKLHVLNDLELMMSNSTDDRISVLEKMRGRLDVLGSNVADKQYLLGVRRAVMSLRPNMFTPNDVSGAWLSSARLARKARSTPQAFNAVLKASALGDNSAALEHAKLMWLEGHHRKAIQTLEGAIESGAFVAHDYVADGGTVTMTVEQRHSQNEVTAKANVLLGKWLDQSGQTQSEIIKSTFRKATLSFRKWEKGWYHLGRYYNKILDSEKAMPPGKESQAFLTGEATKAVIDNYLRSLLNGSKYVFQTLPKILTLWLELSDSAAIPQDPRRGNAEFHAHNAAQRKQVIEATNNQIKKYLERLQPALLYTILPQVVARICHRNKAVSDLLGTIVVKVVRSFPQQAYWTLLAVVESQQKDRAVKGLALVNKIVEVQKKSSKDASAAELRSLFTAGQKFNKELVRISDYPIEGRVSKVSLSKDLGFNHKIAPSKLVVPIQACLIPSMPTSFEPAQLKAFRPFAKDPITVSAFVDEAVVLASLQKPRKLTIRGSDGGLYNVLAKPKDDLRKDQRLMEFNTMINRFLKRDVDAAKRRLYIRTYAVIPLNEECGLIEWVDNLKTFRDIILKLYKDKSIQPNYTEIRNLLDESCSGAPEKVQIFSNKILSTFPPVFHEWFVESFPDPSAWFNARLRYTRSAAVMSIVGHVLGLGDRHGENILFEEDNGGTLHVDFNCLFDKGLTFEKPETVPFRLTHNMVDAMGAYGYEGPFRRCCEITLTLLRSNQDALMTILETFLHDPTTDFINGPGRKKKSVNGVPNTPVEVLEGVRSKVRGMLAGESVPLSVGGYVEEMIQRATDEKNLCKMYIGWCAFF